MAGIKWYCAVRWESLRVGLFVPLGVEGLLKVAGTRTYQPRAPGVPGGSDLRTMYSVAQVARPRGELGRARAPPAPLLASSICHLLFIAGRLRVIVLRTVRTYRTVVFSSLPSAGRHYEYDFNRADSTDVWRYGVRSTLSSTPYYLDSMPRGPVCMGYGPLLHVQRVILWCRCHVPLWARFVAPALAAEARSQSGRRRSSAASRGSVRVNAPMSLPLRQHKRPLRVLPLESGHGSPYQPLFSPATRKRHRCSPVAVGDGLKESSGGKQVGCCCR